MPVAFAACMAADFNIAPTTGPRGEAHVSARNPTLKMTSTKIEISFNKIARLSDVSDLAELLFPGNRNQQHAFLAIWISLKWADHNLVPNLGEIAREHHVTKRTMERVRAKMRRMGLIDHVSRFSSRFGYRERWVLSPRFEAGLRQLAGKAAAFKDLSAGSKDKEALLLGFAGVRRRQRASRE